MNTRDRNLWGSSPYGKNMDVKDPIPRRARTVAQKQLVVRRLLKLWLMMPELRLGQLIGNIYPCGPMPDEVSMKAALAGDFEILPHKDPYSIEDMDFIDNLEESYQRLMR